MACSAFIFAHMWIPPTHKKAKTHLSPKKEFSFSSVSQHACFYSFYAPFWVPHPVFTTSLSSVVRFPMKPDTVTVRWRMFFTRWVAGRVHISLNVPKKHPFEAPLFAHCLFYKRAVTHSTHHAKLNSQLFLEVCVFRLFSATWRSGYCCNRC